MNVLCMNRPAVYNWVCQANSVTVAKGGLGGGNHCKASFILLMGGVCVCVNEQMLVPAHSSQKVHYPDETRHLAHIPLV